MVQSERVNNSVIHSATANLFYSARSEQVLSDKLVSMTNFLQWNSGHNHFGRISLFSSIEMLSTYCWRRYYIWFEQGWSREKNYLQYNRSVAKLTLFSLGSMILMKIMLRIKEKQLDVNRVNDKKQPTLQFLELIWWAIWYLIFSISDSRLILFHVLMWFWSIKLKYFEKAFVQLCINFIAWDDITFERSYLIYYYQWGCETDWSIH